MSDRQPTELASHYMYVTLDNLFASRNNKKITVRVNPNDPDIVTLIVAGLQISTLRDNWWAIFNEFATVLTPEMETKVPARTFRLDFNDSERTLKVVPE